MGVKVGHCQASALRIGGRDQGLDDEAGDHGQQHGLFHVGVEVTGLMRSA